MSEAPAKILLVEDNPGDARLVREMLEEAFGDRLGLSVAATLAEGLNILHEGTFDLLLVDLSLPDSQGIATVERVYDAALDTPIVVMTGLDDETVGVEAVRRGAQDYLVKGIADSRNFTRAVRYSLERHRVIAHLRGHSRMQALGQLTAGVSHEFNNLLTSIIGNLEVLKGQATDNALEADLATAALAAAWRAAGLVNSLRSFSQMQNLRPQVLDLREAVRDVTTLIESTLGDSIAVRLDLPGVPTWILADRGRLQEAIYNLMDNARDALPQGGSITIRIEDRTAAPAATLEAESAIYATVLVADNGIGMAPTTLKRAFEPFFTTKQVGDGVGLGLSMVHGFARQSNGFVELKSEPGKGTTACLALPIVSVPIGQPQDLADGTGREARLPSTADPTASRYG